jgi:hypothetical protein
MTQLLRLPDKYHIVWLDAHIGVSDVHRQLKRAFFTHIDPESEQEVLPSDKDIDQSIRSDSEIPVTFGSFHFTLRTFTEEAACLKYIDEIQDHRILFIVSSTLGQSAVEQLLQRYSHSFTNAKTNKPYDSIYIFCTDMAKAAEWTAPYYDYVQFSDFDTNLLARMTKDLGEEFLKHGQELYEANQNEASIERLSWAKSLFIRHDKLKFPSECLQEKQQLDDPKTTTEQDRIQYSKPTFNQQPKPSRQLQEIDRLLAIVEEKVKQERENMSDGVSRVIEFNFKNRVHQNTDQHKGERAAEKY